MKVHKFTIAFEELFTPKTIAPFLLGTVAVAVLGNAAYQLFTNWLGTTNSAALRIAIGAILIVVTSAWVISRFIGRWRPYPPLVGKKPPDKKKGLILLVSKRETCEKAIAWHCETLRRCWLLCSAQSVTIGESIRDELAVSGKSAEIVFVQDVFDPFEFRANVAAIYSSLPEGWSEKDVAFDFTGMTALASVGGVLACVSEDRLIEYVPARYSKQLDALQPLDPVEVTLSWTRDDKAAQPDNRSGSADRGHIP